MRRLIAYIMLSSSLILGSAAVLTPTIASMDTDISYGYGRDLVFKISNHDESHYNGTDPVENGAYVNDDGYVAVDLVAEEMTERLDHWGVSDYSITKEGYDTVRVRLRTENNSETEYDYLEYYLPFSGGHISVDASMDEDASEPPYSYDEAWADMFTGQTAEIEYINNDTIPVVVIPVNYEGEDGKLGELIEYCEAKHQDADESASTEEVNCYVVLWTHKQETDTFQKATSTVDTVYDANVASRFLGAEASGNAWFDETEDDDDYTRFQYVPSSAAFNGNSSYDATQSEAAYKAAFYYMSLFNASDYAELGAGYDVTFSFSAVASPEVEGLVSRGTSVLPAMNSTMIAALVGLGIAILVLALFYRMAALSMVASLAVSLIATMMLIVYFHAQFGAGMILGLLLVALISIFGSVYYAAKLKDEIYKGRSLKKAHSEAAKKAFWPTIDAGILSIVAGLCVYFLVPAEASMAGLCLVVGGFFATLCSLLLTRVQMWILSGDGDAANRMGGMFGINKEKVPDILKEEKQSYFGLFAESNFMKPWKGVAIAGGVLLLASIASLSVWSGISGGSPFAIGSGTENSIAYITYRIPENSTNDVLNGLDDIDNGSTGVLNIVYQDEEMLSSYSVSEVTMSVTSVTLTNSAEVEDGVYTVLNFMVTFDRVYEDEAEYAFTVNGESFTSLEEALGAAIESKNVDLDSYAVSVKSVVDFNLTPSFTDISIGLCVSILVAMVYLSIRFRPSRGITVSIISGGSAFMALGVLSLVRVSATPIAAIGAIGTFIAALLISLFILGKEKEIAADSRERDKSTLEFRAKCLLSANSQAAGELVIFAVIAAYMFVSFLAFGPSAYTLYNSVALLGIILSAVLILVLISPSSLFLAKQFSKIRFDMSWRKPKKGSGPTKKSAEPEEAVFIGIND